MRSRRHIALLLHRLQQSGQLRPCFTRCLAGRALLNELQAKKVSQSGDLKAAILPWHWQQRGILVDTHGEAGQELSEKDYHRFADLTLGEMMASLEALIEDLPDISDPDLEYSQGVLTLNLGSHGTYVINKQAPNKQIWMSSPVSGPVRYDLVEGQWIYKHDGHLFQERLTDELRQITGKEDLLIELDPELAKGFMGYGADPT